MDIEKKLHERSGSVCELCENKDNLKIYKVPPVSTDVDKCILVCQTCFEHIDDPGKIGSNHWRCLNNSMWSTVPAVQVTVWRLLNALRYEGWPQDLLEMFFLEDSTLAWAKSTVEGNDDAEDEKIIHKDSNGTMLLAGDTVVLIKDLDVKGGGFTAKRGTAVRNISLVEITRDILQQKYCTFRKSNCAQHFQTKLHRYRKAGLPLQDPVDGRAACCSH